MVRDPQSATPKREGASRPLLSPSSSENVPGILGLSPLFGGGYALSAPGSETCAAAGRASAMMRAMDASLIMLGYFPVNKAQK